MISSARFPKIGLSSSMKALKVGRAWIRSRNPRSFGQRARSGATPAWRRFTNGLATLMSAIVKGRKNKEVER